MCSLLTAQCSQLPATAETSSLFGLAPCGVYPATVFTDGAVRSYRTFSPLPQVVKPEAVCSLWHWPSLSLEAQIPDVIRHTALRSSDFPLPKHASASAATARLACNFYASPSCAVCIEVRRRHHDCHEGTASRRAFRVDFGAQKEMGFRVCTLFHWNFAQILRRQGLKALILLDW